MFGLAASGVEASGFLRAFWGFAFGEPIWEKKLYDRALLCKLRFRVLGFRVLGFRICDKSRV